MRSSFSLRVWLSILRGSYKNKKTTTKLVVERSRLSNNLTPDRFLML